MKGRRLTTADLEKMGVADPLTGSDTTSLERRVKELEKRQADMWQEMTEMQAEIQRMRFR